MPGQPGTTGAQIPGGNVTRSQWATSLLLGLGNNSPSNNTWQVVEAWTQQEGGGFTNNCRYNLLNTMQAVPGSTQCPGTMAGIQSYPDVNSGVNANILALQNGNYPALSAALRTNNECALGFNGCQMSPAVARDLSTWVNGPNGPINLQYINAIRKLAGNPGTIGGDVTSSQGSSQPTTPPANPLDALTNWLQSYISTWALTVGFFLLGLVLIIVGFIILIHPSPGDLLKTAEVAA